MSLDVEIPDPPTLDGPQPRGDYESLGVADPDLQDDYRCEEIEAILEDGAWEEAFGEWADTTTLSDEEFRPVVALGLIDQFDFYWDPATDDVGYVAPAIPVDERDAFETGDFDLVEAELDALGRVVTEVFENDYLLRDDDAEPFGFFADDYTGEEPDEDELE